MKKNLLILFFASTFYLAKSQTSTLCFGISNTSTVAGSPNALCSGDFNKDGKTDLAISNSITNDVSIFLGSGTGIFTANANYSVGADPYAIVCADFNNDTIPDLITSNHYSKNVSVLIGLGNGTFSTAVNYSVPKPTALANADFNKDGYTDLALSNDSSFNKVSVLYGAGNGTFNPSMNYYIGNISTLIIAADFNGDTYPDIATANGPSNTVTIKLGSGSGFDTSYVNYSVGTYPASLAYSDFNNDGKTDIVTANSNNISVLLGSGNGTFLPAVNYASSAGLSSIVSVDFNGDSFIDIATTSYNSNSVSVFLGSVNGTFGTPTTFSIGNGPTTLIMDDFNGDSKMDLASANNTDKNASILLNTSFSLSITPVSPICQGDTTSLTATGATSYFWNTGSTSSSIFINPSVTTTYTVTGTTAACSAISIATVMVNFTPTVTVNNATVCAGQSATLNVTGAASYLWSTGAIVSSIVVSPASSTTYTVTGSNGGCTASNIATVIINPSPTIVISASSSVICQGDTTSLSATGASSYFWNTGSSNSSIFINPSVSTTYTVTGTNATGCTAISTATVMVNPTPILTVNDATVCAGQNGILSVTGASSYMWSTGAIVTSIIVSPTSNTTYTVTGSNGGCTASSIATVIVNPLPIITISASSSVICSSNLSILTAVGANTYNWNTSEVSSTIVVSPAFSTNYSVSGTNLFGCISSATIPIIVKPSQTLSGTVTNTLGAVNGNMVLYKYSSLLSKWDSIAFTPLSANYSFGAIDSALYVIKAIPTATNVQVTYGASSISWQGATIITHGCDTTTTHNITIIPLTDIGVGSGSFSGIITQADGFGHRNGFKVTAPGQPIGGIIVKGGRNPGGQMFVQTTTAADGTYTLQGIPDNGGYDYFILVDIAGIDTNRTYHINLIPGNNTITGLDFTIDSIYVNPIHISDVSVHDISAIEHQIKVFPNPAYNKITIQYNLLENSNVKIELYDILGKSVKTILPLTEQRNNNYSYPVQLNDLTTGVYFMKLKINNSESIIKLVIIE